MHLYPDADNLDDQPSIRTELSTAVSLISFTDAPAADTNSNPSAQPQLAPQASEASIYPSAYEMQNHESMIASSDNQKVPAQEDILSPSASNPTNLVSPAASPELPLEPDAQIVTKNLGGDTFHPFPRLVIELRLKIWGFALPSPATLSLESFIDDKFPNPLFFTTGYMPGQQRMDLPEPVRTTALLRTCYESREAYTARFPYFLPFTSPPDRLYQFHTKYYDSDTGHIDDKIWEPAKKWTCSQLRFGPMDTLYLEDTNSIFWDRRFWRRLRSQRWVRDVKAMGFDQDLFRDLLWEGPRKMISILANFCCLQRLEVYIDLRGFDFMEGLQEVQTLKDDWARFKRDLQAKKIKGMNVPEEVIWLNENPKESA